MNISTMRTEFHIFKSNTDAVATNKGFYFQYLLTLQQWIKYYNDSSYEIYCEHEEDIFILDVTTDTREYLQVKCYSTDFALTSDEVVKSLINFYKIYIKCLGNPNCSFQFCTTSGLKPRAGQILRKWYELQQGGSFEVDQFIKPSRTAIVKYLQKSLERYNIKSSSNPGSIRHAKTIVQDFITSINTKQFEDFLQKVRWDFRKYSDQNFEALTSEITQALMKIEFNKSLGDKVFMAYLLHQIIDCSSRSDSNQRKLDSNLFKKLVDDTKDQVKIHQILHREFSQLFDFLPSIDSRLKRVEQNTDDIIQKLSKHNTPSLEPLSLFYDDLRDWFVAVGYGFGDIMVKTSDHFIFNIKIEERRRTTEVLIYGITKVIQVPQLENSIKLRDHYHCDEVWVISTSHASPAARQKLLDKSSSDAFCYNFDELLEETMDFSKYFDWVEQEVKARKIDERFIPVAIKKGEFNIVTKEIVATSIYGESEGWLEGYIDKWLNEQQNEHVSILGEFGTGKTWFTLYYAWKQIERYKLAKHNKTRRPRIPILIFLRDFAKAMQVDVLISDFFFRKHQIEMKGVFKAFNQLNKMGKLLLLFDGFDEMADRIDKQKMIDNFWHLASVVKGQSKVVLTCRNEHFASISEGRNLLNAELLNSTTDLGEKSNSPKFEVVELLKFDADQIKKLLSHVTNEATINLIFENQSIVDLLSRPVMVELVLDAIKEIEHEQYLNLSKVYFYATRNKMERDILQKRTFTSLKDKMFFMSELAWEMLSNSKLTINFK
ncbi:MAG: hypothetical protein JWQ25_700, partial [Daejeonella sp.]|nr:hypothetical protein [Daejeonella sp.]